MATASDSSGSTSHLSILPAGEMAAMDNRVRMAQFTALYRQARITNLVSPVIAPIVGFVMLSEIGGGRIYPWVAVVLLASIARAVVFHSFKRGIPTRSTISLSTKLAFLGAICFSGVAWGGGMLLIFPEGNIALQSFLIVVVLGMGAGSAASFGPYFPAVAVYVIPLTVPIATILLFQNTAMHMALGSFGYIFLVVLLLLGSSAHRIFASSVRLEFENAYLALGLESAQQRLGDAVDSMSEAFAQFDADGRLVLANESLRQLVPELNERSIADIAYEGFVRLFAQAGQAGEPPERVDRCVEKFMACHLSPGELFEVEFADGRWLRVGEQPTRDGGFVAIFSDLTQLKIREAELEKSEQRFRDFTRAASDWVWELDADLRFTSVSGRYTEVSGRSPNFLIGRKMTDVPSASQDPDWQAVLLAVDRKQPFHNRRLTLPDSNDEPFQFLCSGIPVFSDDGTFQGYRGTGSDITAIVRAEARTREVQKQLFDAIESIPAGFILFDKDGYLNVWNTKAPDFLPAHRELVRTGVKYEELIRSSAETGHVMGIQDTQEAWIAEQMSWFDEPEKRSEYRLTDGRFIQKLGRRTADGGIVAIYTDITSIRRDQHELAEKTTLLQATLEGMGEGILVLDRSRRVILVNNQLQQLLDLPSVATAFGASFTEITKQLERDGGSELSGGERDWRLTIADLFDTGSPFQIEHVRPSGTRLLVRANPLEDDGWVLLLTDVTAERTAAAALEESEARYRQLVESSPDLISIHKEGRFSFVNPAGARLIGASSPEELIGRRVLDFVHPDQHHFFRTSSPNDQPGDGSLQEFRALRIDGSEFEAEGISLEFTYRGEPAILGIVRDITLRKLAQAQLVQTSKLATLGELAAGITHELNQPLNVIRLAADSSLILREEDKTDREFETKQFERISAQALRMSKIISHMRVFSRREDDEGERELIDPIESVSAAVSMVRDQFARDNVLIDVNLPGDLCHVYGNPIRLEQVILNLLTNAHDALVLEKVDPESGRTFKTERSGRIQISVYLEPNDSGVLESEETCIVIRIEDNGGGIPDGALERVFDPFFTTKRTGQGTGLGLAIGYNIVDSMGGRILASNGPEGARFEVWLPIEGELENTDSADRAALSKKTEQTNVAS